MNPDKLENCDPPLPDSCIAIVSRRHFLLAAGAGSIAIFASRLPLLAGPLDRKDFEELVPADKKLDPEWVKSLYARGKPTVYRGSELKYIGMPVGGICAGQLYLGGDGQLWHWDIFNRTVPTPGGGQHYANPVEPTHVLDQGFAIHVGGQVRPLNSKGFAEISFCGQYPLATVEYRDANCPLEVSLEAFSPFIPLNVDDSSLPATVIRFTVKNASTSKVSAELRGRMENIIGASQTASKGTRYIRPIREPDLLLLDVGHRPETTNSAAEPPDLGTMVLALLNSAPGDSFSEPVEADLQKKIIGHLSRKLDLKPGDSATATFVISWNFPNLVIGRAESMKGRYYATKFDSALAVARYVAANFDRLYTHTKLWCTTWYDQSTLPHWFLERTLANASILATSTCYRFAGGRFYAYEGVARCPGTCTHVWSYEQTMGRLFPDLDRILREMVDYKIAFNEKTGGIGMRGEELTTLLPTDPAVDGQAGTILRTYRDHQVSIDDAFLRHNWRRIKRAMQYLIDSDTNKDGILEGPQHNTLDTAWYGSVAWLSGLYLAALRAAAEMANDAGDAPFATECLAIADRGRENIVKNLFDGEYFISKPDPEHADAINSGSGCEIDQVLGQSWAFQVGLERVIPEKETRSALRSIWRYNFAPDVGPYRQRYQVGRWYALPGEAGVIMCTFPRSDWSFEQASGKHEKDAEDYASYFNECMNGFEHQVAGHMIWEGMTKEGLAIERAVHDRYHAAHRNPWNEIECGDHYARSMASYGVFLAACGFQYHGPKGFLAFAPRMAPEDFAAAFTAAEGWGRLVQKRNEKKWEVSIQIRFGSMRLVTIALAWPRIKSSSLVVINGTHKLPVTSTFNNDELTISLAEPVILQVGSELTVRGIERE